MMDISRLLEMREYDRDNRRKGKLIAQAYKLKDTLTQMYRKCYLELRRKPTTLAAWRVSIRLFR